jgi:hypothetical protein
MSSADEFDRSLKSWFIVVVLAGFLALLATLAYCQEESCYPTPSPLPPEGVIHPGTLIVPPVGGQVVITASPDGGPGVATIEVVKWGLTVNWDQMPEWYLDSMPYQKYWLLDDYPRNYCRFDCENLNTDPDADAMWQCLSDCFGFTGTGIEYTVYAMDDCETWENTVDELLIEEMVRTIRGRSRGRAEPGE